ncbi:MAG: hypothetical protein K2H60_01770 [Muribaculaceae bacterium]|nr:hypothetical protein [Muribaculaceae bacterium]
MKFEVFQYFNFIVAFLIGLSITSCSHDKSASDIISEGFHLAKEGKFDEAQLKGLQAEELLKKDSPLTDRESLARLYGLIYYNQNVKDKAKEHLREALKYAVAINDTSLIEMNLFNLGLCATTEKDVVDNFVRAADLFHKTGNKSLQSSALDKLAQGYISSNKYKEAQQSLDEASALCEDNSSQQSEIDMTQCRLWLAEGKYDAALQGYRSLDSLNINGCLLRAIGIYDILVHQRDYKNALAYKDSIYLYTDSIKKLDGSRQVDEIEKAYHANIEQKNQRFQILLWGSLSVLTAVLLILCFVLKALRLKKLQVELNDEISALNARIIELMSNNDNKEAHEVVEEDVDSILRLIEQKYELSLEVFKTLSQYETLKKLNLIKDISTENKTEVRSVYEAIVGRFSGCCSDIRQAFPGLTNDDCVFCTMNFIGCTKEVISSALGSSEEALRRRKSRIKQKLPENLFRFFFSK